MRVLLLLLWLATALAQEGGWSEAQLSLIGQPGTPPATEAEVDKLTEEISDGLRCPVCQGMPVSESPSSTAVAWKDSVRDLVEMGYDRQQIEGFFVTMHGEWVLLQPKARGLNWVLWLAPAGLAGLGFLVMASYSAQWAKEPEETPDEDDPEAVDSYEARLLAELEEDY